MSQPETPSSPETNPNITPSISAATHTYQHAMQTQSHSATPPASTNSSVLQMPGATRDVVMEDVPLHRPAVCLILPPDPVPPVPAVPPVPPVPPSSYPSIGQFLSRLSTAVEILTHTSPSQSPAAAILPPNTQTHSPILPPTHQSSSTSTANINRDTASPVPVPARTSTPVPKVNGNAENSSRATSQHPDTGPSLPTEASVHGAPARVYLNQTVTGSLLEGMKLLAKEQPKDPLRVLGEFLLSKSKELEAGN
ncbi:COMPASS (complex proteins associated with Set1p) component [Ciborinia camelliae]|nr:COMPASS (complex proteins associated with Set1p) component [Ciborinia camelliae]